MTTHCTPTALAATSLSAASLAATALAPVRDCTTGARLTWPLRAGARYLRTWLQRREDRAAFQATLALDDHLLDDIGVTREDVLWANSLPLSESAAEALQARAYSNRHYR